MLFKIIVSLMLLSAMIAPCRASAETQNRIVAVVNSDVITLYELDNRIRAMTAKSSEELRRLDEEQYIKTRRQVLNLLVDEKLTQEKVAALGVRVDQKEVDAAIERIKANNSLTQEDLLAALKRDGLTMEAYRENVRRQIERMHLINAEVQSKIIIRDEAIREYYAAHKDEFQVDEEVHLASIFVVGTGADASLDNQALLRKAQGVVEKHRAGEDFAKLAKEYSRGPGAGEGGDMGQFKTGQLNEALREIIGRMSVGDVSDPVPIPKGYQIVKLLGRKSGKTRSLEEVKDAVFEKLYMKETDKRYSAWIKELREKAYLRIVF
jgi:peptidyl-prolyl cis-trans isomerase SurA